jgi:UDP-N-acetylmuramoylalanine--D-glutamate ligase
MTNLIKDLDSYKNIAIWGFGREGKAVYNFIKKYLPSKPIFIIDSNPDITDISMPQKEFELIIKSPGISLYKLGINYSEYNFTSSTELFIKHFKNQIIGITGTKGKSTTTKFLGEMLGIKIAGNIGIPIFEIIEEIGENLVVYELSSHQLFNIRYSPFIAVLTNLYEEHLDYYASKDEYFKSKMNIFKFQNPQDFAIFNEKNFAFAKNYINSKINFYNSNCCENMYEFENKFIHSDTIKIALQVAKILNLEEKKVFETLQNFSPLPHRMEFVCEKNGIKFYNDSISTIPETSINAITTLNPDTVIIGGDDRGVNYSPLIKFLEKREINVILMYESGEKIYKNLKKAVFVENLDEAVKKAFEITKKCCLLSPGAASYNHFKNFEERGEKFKNLILL